MSGDALDEERWSMYARATAAHRVQSSLSLPLLDDSQVVGGLNLYGSSRDTFVGHVEALAAAIGATSVAAVGDADLSFRTLADAVRALSGPAPSQLAASRR
ncbi:MAG: hypothetical protein ABI083_09555 [Lapillicoccus sp.]